MEIVSSISKIGVKKIAMLAGFLVLSSGIWAQYCGSSGSFQCSPQSVSLNPGFYPSADSFAVLVNNYNTSASFQFRNYNTILFGNELLNVYSLRFDTISNLPSGTCWATDRLDNTYGTSENGCIQINGIPCDYTGQYKLHIIVTVDIGQAVQSDGGPGGLIYFLRLINNGNAIFPVDFLQTDQNTFIPYGGSCLPAIPLSLSLNGSQIVCDGSIETLNPIVSGGAPPYTFLWQSTGNNLSCNNCENPTVTLSQNSSYTLLVTDVNSDTITSSVTYNVVGSVINSQINSSGPVVFCKNGSVTLNAVADSTLTYQWYEDGNAIAGATSASYTVTDVSGNYNVVITEPSVCEASSNIIPLTFFAAPPAVISTLGSANLCLGSMVIIEADTSTGVLTYQWQINGVNDSIITPAYFAYNAGDYRVIVTNSFNCRDTSNVITVADNSNLAPLVNLTGYPDTVCYHGSPISLAGNDPVGGNFSGSAVFGNIFYPDSALIGANSITYTYTDGNGCSNWVTDSVLVVFCGATSVNELNLTDNISIYPNPASGFTNITSDLFLAKSFQIIVFDLSGKQVEVPRQVQREKIVFDTSHLSSGMYLIDLHMEGQRAVRKIVIEN